MGTEEYYLTQKWQNLYSKGSLTKEHDRILIENVLMFPKLITSAGLVPEEEEIWAWNEITANFNNNQVTRMNWLAIDLKARYNLIKPLVLTQTMYIPCSPLTKEMLICLQRITKNRKWDEKDNLPRGQAVLKENLDWIRQLPEKQRKSLESKIAQLMLDVELRNLSEIKKWTKEDFKKLEKEMADDFERLDMQGPPPEPKAIVIDDSEECNDENKPDLEEIEISPLLVEPVTKEPLTVPMVGNFKEPLTTSTVGNSKSVPVPVNAKSQHSTPLVINSKPTHSVPAIIHLTPQAVSSKPATTKPQVIEVQDYEAPRTRLSSSKKKANNKRPARKRLFNPKKRAKTQTSAKKSEKLDQKSLKIKPPNVLPKEAPSDCVPNQDLPIKKTEHFSIQIPIKYAKLYTREFCIRLKRVNEQPSKLEGRKRLRSRK